MDTRQVPPTAAQAATGKLRLAVFKFSSCDGCQLQLLNLEETLLDLADTVEIAFFLEARSRIEPGPYDVGLVEGSISTPREEEQIKQIRRQCRMLVTIGACATSAARNRCATGPTSTSLPATSIPIRNTSRPWRRPRHCAHVFVDFELRGCPINHFQVLELISALLAGRRPNVSTHSVCIECKRRGWPCVLVAQGLPCLGPVTQVGCGALCPAYQRACYGCFGPMEQPNIHSLGSWFTEKLDYNARDLKRMLRQSNGYLEPFKQASDQYEQREHAF